MKEHTTVQSQAALTACTVIAVDLAKRVFQVAGEDALGKVIYEERIKSRQAFAAFLRGLPAASLDKRRAIQGKRTSQPA